MAKTISSSVGPVTLLAGDNPVYISGAEGGAVTGTSFGIFGNASQSWTIHNEGSVKATGAGYFGTGISLAGSGTILNIGGVAYAAYIGGYSDGVVIGAGGSVANDGTITGGRNGVRIAGTGTVTNSGTLNGGNGNAVYLGDGGSLDNSGTITGHNRGDGVRVAGQAGTVSNSGAIYGRYIAGIYLKAGGTVANLGTGAVVSGHSRGIAIYSGGSVTNENTITGNEYGVSIYGAGYVANNGADALISGGTTGIVGRSGPLTITNSGTIAGDNAIYLHDGGTVTNSGELLGRIRAGGAPTITNTGTITEDHNAAIFLFAGGGVTNGDASFTGAGIIGSGYGIYIRGAAGTVVNFGTITETAPVYPIGNNGVRLVDGGTVINGDATSTVALISGYGDGVRIGNSLYGSAGTVTNDGTIIGGSDAAGIRLIDGGTVINGTGTNTAAAVLGGSGVYAGHYYNSPTEPYIRFAGEATILNIGTITGTGAAGSGVMLAGGGSVGNGGVIAGYIRGIWAAWHPITVTNDGTITATGTYSSSFGIGLYSHEASYIVNGSPTNHGALISGANYGVSLGDGSTLVNHGTISGGALEGVVIDSGTLTNAEGGLIAGNIFGVEMLRAGTIINDGAITASSGTGVKLAAGTALTNGGGSGSASILGAVGLEAGFTFVDSYGTTTSSAPSLLSNAGTITGTLAAGANTGVAVLVHDASSIANSGRIDGAYIGVLFDNQAGTVTNTGIILGGNFVAIKTPDGSAVANSGTAATIDGGIYVSGSGTVTNEGTITGHYAVYLHDGGSLTNSGTAAQIGSSDAIAVRAGSGAAVTIVNDGTIAGHYSGIRMAGGGMLTNGGSANAAALISGYDGAGIATYDVASTVTNYGTVTSAYADAIFFAGGGTIINAAGGLIAGSTAHGRAGIASYDTATVLNSGSITGVYGVALYAGSVTNSGTASYIGGFGGVFGIRGPAALTVSNEGTINGTITGVALFSGGTVTNSGTAALIQSTGGVGIQLMGIGSVANEGTVAAFGPAILAGYGRTVLTNGSATDTTAQIAGMYGALFVQASGVVRNFGTIAGYRSGVAFLNRKGVVTNRGLIQAPGGTESGYGVVLGKGGTLTNTGTIIGTYGVVAGYPCGCSPGGAVSLTNSGTIVGTGGIAVQLGDFDDTVAIRPGAVFDGIVIAGAGNDTLALLAAGPVGTISGLGSDFIGLETIALSSASSRWLLAGTNMLDDGATIASAGRLTVSGQLGVAGVLHIEGTGTLSASATGAIEIGTAGGAASGRITIDADGKLSGNGVLRGPVTNRGTIEIGGGTLTTLGAVGGSGTIAITAGAVLDARANMSVRHVVFAGTGTDETLLAAKADRLVGIISGFADHDAIDLTGFAADPTLTSFAGNVLTLHELGGPGSVGLHFAPGYSLGDFVVASDGAAGTIITHG